MHDFSTQDTERIGLTIDNAKEALSKIAKGLRLEAGMADIKDLEIGNLTILLAKINELADEFDKAVRTLEDAEEKMKKSVSDLEEIHAAENMRIDD